MIWIFIYLNVLTFIVLAIDKYKARHNYYRINENYLFILFLCGGWLGGYVGMIVCNHKLKKFSFICKAILMTVCNIAVLNVLYKLSMSS